LEGLRFGGLKGMPSADSGWEARRLGSQEAAIRYRLTLEPLAPGTLLSKYWRRTNYKRIDKT
jgi:hypothetical protein